MALGYSSRSSQSQRSKAKKLAEKLLAGD